ncbi:DNA processing protein [Melghirimyces thermohalophilus]|uniref:DNA processing protein n=1 Tax=Melghirimyces thermohalophilus TaxID=1236220 RepID=A0A1G6IYW2_9BACL|nr:DNA-processing protein DprA [Melghirimyces thermohalophilus]SDC11697.1 DNA processing protein [Melghirimyces thermohalophilus]
MGEWEERIGLVAMHQIRGVGWHTLDKLRRLGWDPGRQPTDAELNRWKREIPGGTVARIGERWTADFIDKVDKELAVRQIQPVTLLDEEYPPMLGQLPQPPWVLYVRGEVSLLSETCLAVVGSRKPTSYGRRVTRQLSREMAARGWTVVSGLATGVDGEAHRAALEAKGKTIAVMGCGVDVVYPRHHRDLYKKLVHEGAVVSEVPPGTEPHPGLFPQRNRIISGLSYGTLVTEAAEKSGSLITAHYSLEQGREVFSVPGLITSALSRGTNQLIQQGAKPILQVEDILEEFPYLKPDPPRESESPGKVAVSEAEDQLLALLKEEPIHLDQLAEHSGQPVTEIHQHLLSLQVKGLIRQLPGAQFVRV